MLSKNRIKLIHSLEKKKYRNEEGLFVAEGPKLIEELLNCYQPQYLAATPEWMQQHRKQVNLPDEVCDEVSQDELNKASLLRTPQQVLALFRLPNDKATLAEEAAHSLCLALDGVQDPGNIGTIVRLADWFGIRHIFCSKETVDVYSPKAIQATMGAIARVRVHYIDLYEELKSCSAPIYGTHLDGDNLYENTLTPYGVIVMGNEGNGISAQISTLVNKRLFIPPYPQHSDKVESLNVAIATAIICAEFRRRQG